MNKLFEIEKRCCYTRTYLIDPAITGYEDVRVIAECKDSPEYPEDGAFSLELYLQISNHSFRDFLFGAGFGTKGMSKEEIDDQIDSFVYPMLLDGDLIVDCRQYMEEVSCIEEQNNRRLLGK